MCGDHDPSLWRLLEPESASPTSLVFQDAWRKVAGVDTGLRPILRLCKALNKRKDIRWDAGKTGVIH